jgi:hypothetical protein
MPFADVCTGYMLLGMECLFGPRLFVALHVPAAL